MLSHCAMARYSRVVWPTLPDFLYAFIEYIHYIAIGQSRREGVRKKRVYSCWDIICLDVAYSFISFLSVILHTLFSKHSRLKFSIKMYIRKQINLLTIESTRTKSTQATSGNIRHLCGFAKWNDSFDLFFAPIHIT